MNIMGVKESNYRHIVCLFYSYELYIQLSLLHKVRSGQAFSVDTAYNRRTTSLEIMK